MTTRKMKMKAKAKAKKSAAKSDHESSGSAAKADHESSGSPAKADHESSGSPAKADHESSGAFLCDEITSYGKKKILALFVQPESPRTWTEIDPHYSSSSNSPPFAVNNFMKDLNSPPPHLGLHKLHSCGRVVFDSKLYFIGGQYDDAFIDTQGNAYHCRSYSAKIFTYHLFTHDWEELECKLNVTRCFPDLLVLGSVIYIMGGVVGIRCLQIENKAHWMECFDALDVRGKKTCDFLPTSSLLSDNFYRYSLAYRFAYQPRNELVFVMPYGRGAYAFNCVSKTWAPFHDDNISDQMGFRCDRVALVGHLVFSYYEGTVYAYDLNIKERVMSQRLPSSFGGVDDPKDDYPLDTSTLYLERVGDDTLVLFRWDYDRDTGKELHLYKFQIENDNGVVRLLQAGSGHFFPPGYSPIDVITA